jgi:putative acetyltransferase
MYYEENSHMSVYTIETINLEKTEAYRSLLATAAEQEKYLGLTEAPPLDALKSAVSESMKSGHPMYMASLESQAIGWCCIYQNMHLNFQHLGQLFIGVLKPWQGFGVGKSLLSIALDKAWLNGLHRIELEVCVSNTPAVRLYSKFGFQTEGIKRNAYYVDNHYEDLLVMSILHDP